MARKIESDIEANYESFKEWLMPHCHSLEKNDDPDDWVIIKPVHESLLTSVVKLAKKILDEELQTLSNLFRLHTLKVMYTNISQMEVENPEREAGLQKMLLYLSKPKLTKDQLQFINSHLKWPGDEVVKVYTIKNDKSIKAMPFVKEALKGNAEKPGIDSQIDVAVPNPPQGAMRDYMRGMRINGICGITLRSEKTVTPEQVEERIRAEIDKLAGALGKGDQKLEEGYRRFLLREGQSVPHLLRDVLMNSMSLQHGEFLPMSIKENGGYVIENKMLVFNATMQVFSIHDTKGTMEILCKDPFVPSTFVTPEMSGDKSAVPLLAIQGSVRISLSRGSSADNFKVNVKFLPCTITSYSNAFYCKVFETNRDASPTQYREMLEPDVHTDKDEVEDQDRRADSLLECGFFKVSQPGKHSPVSVKPAAESALGKEETDTDEGEKPSPRG